MTNPQNELYRLANNIERLCNLFEADENGGDICETVNEIYTEIINVKDNQERLQNQLNLIIKLLSKDVLPIMEQKFIGEP